MISFIIPKGHIYRHFPGECADGSVFYAETPAQVLTYAASAFPDVFKNAVPDAKDGRKRLSFIAEKEIGLCNVVAIDELTPDEAARMNFEKRDGILVKTVQTARTFPTKEFQVILDARNTVITIFPGPMAPPLPRNGEHSEFWDNHVFIRPIQ
jgi:hypothetical protein